MSDLPTSTKSIVRPRLARVDIARGIALLGVIAYHLCWDLRYFEFVLWPMDTDWRWVAVQKALISAFVGLSGFSLWLAHGKGINWAGFWRRWAVLAGAAALITLATWFTFQPAFVYFGVLHALALFALLGLLFLRLPIGPLSVLGLAIIILGIAFDDPAFNVRPLSWLGFWTVPPYTNDLVPVFPWFGVFLVGLALGRFLTRPALAGLVAGPVSWGRFGRFLAFVGRHSLIIYLVHQPLLLGILVPLETVMQPRNWYRAERFVGDCRASCEMSASDPAYCQRYCACSLEQIENDDLWDAVTAPNPTVAQRQQTDAVVGLCIAMGRAAKD